MKTERNRRSIITVFLLLCTVSVTFSQLDSKPWERLGLSITEWELIEKHHMTMGQVDKLLMDGIGISEYFEKPWTDLGITEEKWLSLRRTGLTTADIKRQQLMKTGEFIKNEKPADNTFEELDASDETGALFTSFIAPGYLQLQDKRKIQGRVMVGLAAGSVVGTVALSIGMKQFISLPLFAILIPDMVWSMVNQKNYMRNELQ